jgi:hypothetical protein
MGRSDTILRSGRGFAFSGAEALRRDTRVKHWLVLGFVSNGGFWFLVFGSGYLQPDSDQRLQVLHTEAIQAIFLGFNILLSVRGKSAWRCCFHLCEIGISSKRTENQTLETRNRSFLNGQAV